MNSSFLDGLDLNLLRTLDVLLEERSVTRAARVLGRSQPAVSHALARLRDALDDPLLVREGRSLVPTPRAESLHRAIRPLLAELAHALETPPRFDPATDARTFRLAAPDVLAPLLPGILAELAEAPGVGLELGSARGIDALDRYDLVLDVLPDEAPGVVARRLGALHSAVACRGDHPLVGAPLTVERWCRYPHVLVRTGDASPSMVEVALGEHGYQRSVGLTVSGLLLIPHVLSATDLVFTGPREVLRPLAETLDLALLDPPLPLPAVPVAAMWRERSTHEPGHRWFRGKVIGVLERALTAA